MATKVEQRTTFESAEIIQPFYTGGGISISSDGIILATTLGEDVIFTNTAVGRQLGSIAGDGETVTTLSLTPDASHIVVCSRSLSLRIFEISRNESVENALDLKLLRTLKPHSSPIVTSAVDSTGTLIAVGAADGSIKIIDIRGGYVTHTFHGHTGIISALHFFEVVGAPSRQPSKKSQKRGSLLNGDTSGDTNGETSIGYRLASGGEDGHIRIWDLHKRKAVANLDSHVSVVRSIDFSKDHNLLLSGSRDRTLILWSAGNWKQQSTIPVLETVESTGFISSTSYVFLGGESGRLRIWDLSTSNEVTQDDAADDERPAVMEILQLHSDGALITVHEDQVLIYRSTHPLAKPGITLSEPLPVLRQVSGTHDEVIDMAFLGLDKKAMALATNSEDLKLISVAQDNGSGGGSEHEAPNFGADIASLRGHEDIIICLDVDWSGHWVVTGAKDNTARLWRLDFDERDFDCYATFTGHAESLGAVAFPHNTPAPTTPAFKQPLDHPPPFIISGSQDKTIKRWEVPKSSANTGRPKALYTRKAHDKDINAIDTSDDATLFASASQDRTAKIWKAATGEVVGMLRGHRRGVWAVRFAPSSTPSITNETGATTSKGYIATGGGDKTVRIWSLADFSCLRTLESHTNSVLKVVWLPPFERSGRATTNVQVASAAGDGLVKIWDVSSGELATTLDNHTDRVWALAVKSESAQEKTREKNGNGADHGDEETSSSTMLVSGGADGVITFWKDTTAATTAALATQNTERLEQDQALANAIRARSYRQAITLALQLDHPARLLQLFRAVAATQPPEEGSWTGSKDVDNVIATLGDEQLWLLLLRLRDWNTNARNSSVAQRVFSAVLRLIPRERLLGLKPPRWRGGDVAKGRGRAAKRETLKDILDGLKAYSERHYERIRRMAGESYMIQYTLQQMDDVAAVDGFGSGRVNGPSGGDIITLEG